MKIIKYESLNLFETITEWKLMFSELIKGIDLCKYNSIFDLIKDFVSFYFRKKNNPLLLTIDHYSSLYDKNNEIEKLKDYCDKQKNLDIYIIHELNNINDQKNFIEYLKNEDSVINSISRYEELTNQVNLSLSNVACFIGYELRGLSEIKNNILNQKDDEIINMKKYMENLPKDYNNYFGNNSSFYFKYASMNESIKFEDFVENEKINIKNHIINFIESNNAFIKTDDLYTILINIKTNENKEIQILEKEDNYLNYIDTSYFLFQKIKKENISKYKYIYLFPLIEIIFNEILNLYNNKYFIVIKSDEFKKLDGVNMGIFFDRYINDFIKKNIPISGFMEYSTENIESYDIPYLIPKNNKEANITKMCSSNFIENEIRASKELNNIIKKSQKIMRRNCIILFQAFNAKSIDICFIVKRNKENKNYSINSLQIKCSDSYSIDGELLNTNRYEMTYLKYKLEKLFHITIDESYITYLSISDIKKKCAKNNADKFFYYKRDDGTFVDEFNNVIKNLPFYDSCKINFIDIKDNIKFIRDIISHIFPKEKFSLDETVKGNVIKNGKQINNSAIIKIKNNIIKENIIVKDKSYEFEKENISEFKNDQYYFIINFFY